MRDTKKVEKKIKLYMFKYTIKIQSIVYISHIHECQTER